MIESLVPNASTYAGHIDGLFSIIFWSVGFWFVLAEGVLFWLIFKFRAKPGRKAMYLAGEDKNETKWISSPHYLIILFDVVIIVATVFVWMNVKQRLPGEIDARVRVIAQQWAWTFQHPGPDGKLDTDDDIFTVDELHLEKDRTYAYELTSKDVLHNFSVPVFRLKQDAVPGRVITGWFRATQLGEFDVQCAEMCGIGHGLMPARVSIETPEQHYDWISSQRV